MIAPPAADPYTRFGDSTPASAAAAQRHDAHMAAAREVVARVRMNNPEADASELDFRATGIVRRTQALGLREARDLVLQAIREAGLAT